MWQSSVLWPFRLQYRQICVGLAGVCLLEGPAPWVVEAPLTSLFRFFFYTFFSWWWCCQRCSWRKPGLLGLGLVLVLLGESVVLLARYWCGFGCVEVAVLCVCEVEVFKPELVGRETGVEEGGGSANDVLLGVASGGVRLPGWVGRMASSGACRSCFGLPEFHQSLQHSEP